MKENLETTGGGMDVIVQLESFEECCICLSSLRGVSGVCVLACCKNGIHTHCFLEYISRMTPDQLGRGVDCPLCRTTLTRECIQESIRRNDINQFLTVNPRLLTFSEIYFPRPIPLTMIVGLTMYIFFLISTFLLIQVIISR